MKQSETRAHESLERILNVCRRPHNLPEMQVAIFQELEKIYTIMAVAEKWQEDAANLHYLNDNYQEEIQKLHEDVIARDAALKLNKEESMHWFRRSAQLMTALETISRTTFSGSNLSDDYMKGNKDAHAFCSRLAKKAFDGSYRNAFDEPSSAKPFGDLDAAV